MRYLLNICRVIWSIVIAIYIYGILPSATWHMGGVLGCWQLASNGSSPEDFGPSTRNAAAETVILFWRYNNTRGPWCLTFHKKMAWVFHFIWHDPKITTAFFLLKQFKNSTWLINFIKHFIFLILFKNFGITKWK